MAAILKKKKTDMIYFKNFVIFEFLIPENIGTDTNFKSISLF